MTVADIAQQFAGLPQDADLTFMAVEKDENGFLYFKSSFRKIIFYLDENKVQITTTLEEEVYTHVR